MDGQTTDRPTTCGSPASTHRRPAARRRSRQPDGAGALRGQEDHRRPGRAARAARRRPARPRPHPRRGRARPGQDAGRQVAGGGHRRAVPPGPVHARPGAGRPRRHPDLPPAAAASSRSRSGPVFTNLLLADEINRAPAKVQSALLEVMQEQQVTIGRETHHVPRPFLVMATQNPIESEGTYPLPEAQVDRFMMKVLVGYPSADRGVRRSSSGRSTPPPATQQVIDPERADRDAAAGRPGVRRPGADRVLGAPGQRHPRARPSSASATSPATSASAPARARRSTWCWPPGPWPSSAAATTPCPQDVTDLALDVLRHRLVLSYEALSDEVTADQLVLGRVMAALPVPDVAAAGALSEVRRARRPRPAAAPPGVAGRPPPRRAAAGPYRTHVLRHRASTSPTCARTRPRTTSATSTGTSPPGSTSRTCASTPRTASSPPGWCSTGRRRWRSGRRSAARTSVLTELALPGPAARPRRQPGRRDPVRQAASSAR